MSETWGRCQGGKDPPTKGGPTTPYNTVLCEFLVIGKGRIDTEQNKKATPRLTLYTHLPPGNTPFLKKGVFTNSLLKFELMKVKMAFSHVSYIVEGMLGILLVSFRGELIRLL